MSPDLRDHLLRLNLDYADSTIDPERVVWLACDLLVAGLDSPALRELVQVNDENDGVYAALNTYDHDPEPLRGYVREYLRLAEKQLTRW